MMPFDETSPEPVETRLSYIQLGCEDKVNSPCGTAEDTRISRSPVQSLLDLYEFGWE